MTPPFHCFIALLCAHRASAGKKSAAAPAVTAPGEGFKFLREETFTSGGLTHTVACL